MRETELLDRQTSEWKKLNKPLNEVGSSAEYCTLADTHDLFEASTKNDKKIKKKIKNQKKEKTLV